MQWISGRRACKRAASVPSAHSVTVRWRDVVLETRYLPPGERFCIGAHRGADFALPASMLGGERVTLIPTADGVSAIQPHRWGEVTAVVQAHPLEPRFPRVAWRRLLLSSLAATLCLSLVAVLPRLMAAAAGPDFRQFEEPSSEQRRYIQHKLKIADEPERAPWVPPLAARARGDRGSAPLGVGGLRDTPSKARADASRRETLASRSLRRKAVLPLATSPTLATEITGRADDFGLLALTTADGSFGEVSSGWADGGHVPLTGIDWAGVERRPYHGLGLSGSGEGGGGKGDGVIGLGNVRTAGRPDWGGGIYHYRRPVRRRVRLQLGIWVWTAHTAGEVRGVVTARRQSFARCVTSDPQMDVQLLASASLSLTVDVGRFGAVRRVTPNGIVSASMRSCLVSTAKSLRFREPRMKTRKVTPVMVSFGVPCFAALDGARPGLCKPAVSL